MENKEIKLLGLLVKKPELFADCQSITAFENPLSSQRLNAVFSNAQKQYNETGKVDRRILAKDCIAFGVEKEFFFELSKSAGFEIDVNNYVESILDSLIKRKLSSMAHYTVNCVEDDLNTGSEYLRICRDAIEEIEKRSATTTGVTIPEAIQEIYEKAEALAEGKTEHYLKTGILAIDRLIMGLTTKTMSVMAARPSVGKTAFGLTVMSNMMSQGIGCAFISVEMSEAECLERIAQVRSNVSIYDFAHGLSLEGQKAFYNHLEILASCPHLQIERTINRKISNIRNIARKMKNKNPNLKVIFIDYLQLMVGLQDHKGNREQEISQISRSLKALAKELNIPIMALSQLSRAVETRAGDKKPILSDLRESGAIEQDADMVIFIHRPERFGLLQDAEGNSTKGLAEIIIAKHRNGSVGDVQLKFKAEQAKFTELDEDFLSGIGDLDNGMVTVGSKMNTGDSSNPAKDELQPNIGHDDVF